MTDTPRADAQHLAAKLLAHKKKLAQDEIASMAAALGMDEAVPGKWYVSTEQPLQMAVAISSAEREACAKVCDQKTDHKEAAKAKKYVADACAEKDQKRELNALRHELTVSTFNAGIAACAKAIRARGGNV